MAISDSHAAHIGRVEVTFVLSGLNLNPDAVTTRTGIRASESARRGETRLLRHSARVRTYPGGFWKLSSKGLVVSKDINEHFDCVLDRLRPHQAAFRELAQA